MLALLMPVLASSSAVPPQVRLAASTVVDAVQPRVLDAYATALGFVNQPPSLRAALVWITGATASAAGAGDRLGTGAMPLMATGASPGLTTLVLVGGTGNLVRGSCLSPPLLARPQHSRPPHALSTPHTQADKYLWASAFKVWQQAQQRRPGSMLVVAAGLSSAAEGATTVSDMIRARVPGASPATPDVATVAAVPEAGQGEATGGGGGGSGAGDGTTADDFVQHVAYACVRDGERGYVHDGCAVR